MFTSLLTFLYSIANFAIHRYILRDVTTNYYILLHSYMLAYKQCLDEGGPTDEVIGGQVHAQLAHDGQAQAPASRLRRIPGGSRASAEDT